MLAISNNLFNPKYNEPLTLPAIVVDGVVGAILLAIGIAALLGKIHLPQSVSIAMVTIGAFQFSPLMHIISGRIREKIAEAIKGEGMGR